MLDRTLYLHQLLLLVVEAAVPVERQPRLMMVVLAVAAVTELVRQFTKAETVTYQAHRQHKVRMVEMGHQEERQKLAEAEAITAAALTTVLMVVLAVLEAKAPLIVTTTLAEAEAHLTTPLVVLEDKVAAEVLALGSVLLALAIQAEPLETMAAMEQ